jgi:hypothetical protein
MCSLKAVVCCIVFQSVDVSLLDRAGVHHVSSGDISSFDLRRVENCSNFLLIGTLGILSPAVELGSIAGAFQNQHSIRQQYISLFIAHFHSSSFII